MLSLSVNRWGFTDKLFKINNLSVRRRVFHGQNPFRETTIIRNSRGAHKKCGALRGMRQTQNWIESNNLHVVIWSILLRVKKI